MSEPDRWNILDRLCSEVEAKNGVLVFNWHNCQFNKNDYPGSGDAFKECIKRCLDKGAVFKTLAEYYKELN